MTIIHIPVPRGRGCCRFQASGFTLVELLTSLAILAVLMLFVFGIIQMTQDAWKKSAGRIESMQNARIAYESMTSRLSQATLNTHYDYFDQSRRSPSDPAYAGPDIYGRQSQLHFVSGKELLPGQVTHAVFFQAPLGYTDDKTAYGGMDRLMTACGYYITYGQDPDRPAFLDSLANPPTDEYRYRLMEYRQPTQHFSLYTTSAFTLSGSRYKWIEDGIGFSGGSHVRPLALNIVALILLPTRSPRDEAMAAAQGIQPLAGDYEYDSCQASGSWVAGSPQPAQMHQLPPLLKVVMVAIDEVSARRLGNNPTAPNLGQSGLTPQLFQTSDQLQDDLKKFEDVLNALPGNVAGNTIKLNYRIFQTDVAIRGAKWSE